MRCFVGGVGLLDRCFVVGGDEKRGEHGLQSVDQRVGFFVALKQGFDLRVLPTDLAAQKIIFPFEQRQ